ncbi:MAG: aa3-type cytochrome c oxidase subunit IV [Alphaproteobacteria bacterium]
MSTEENSHKKGEMDISMHEGTYAGFMTMSKVGIVGVVALLAIMAITLV